MTTAPDPIAFRDAGEGWHRRRHRLLGLRVLALLLAAAGVYAAGRAFSASQPGLGLWFLLLAAGLLPLLMGRRARGVYEPRLVELSEGPGLLLPERPASTAALVSSLLLALAAWLAPLAALGVVDPDPGAGDAPLAAVVLTVAVCLGAGLLLALSAWEALDSRRAPDRGLLLRPQSVVLRSSRGAVRFAWTEVRAVRAHWTRARGLSDALVTPRDLVQNWLTFELGAGGTGPGTSEATAPVVPRALAAASRQSHPTVEVSALGAEPGRVLALCRYYLEHADDRAELGGESALRRAATQDAVR